MLPVALGLKKREQNKYGRRTSNERTDRVTEDLVQLIHKLQKVQNNAARLICRTPKFDLHRKKKVGCGGLAALF